MRDFPPRTPPMTSTIALGARWAPWPGGEVAGIPAHLSALCGLLRVTSISDLTRAIDHAPVEKYPAMIAAMVEPHGLEADLALIGRLPLASFLLVLRDLIAAAGGGLTQGGLDAILTRYSSPTSTDAVT